VRYKNWKMYYTMSQPGATGWLLPLTSFHFTLVQNIKRDPFEQAVGTDQKTVMSFGGALAAPSTAYLYDWNLLYRRLKLPTRVAVAGFRKGSVRDSLPP